VGETSRRWDVSATGGERTNRASMAICVANTIYFFKWRFNALEIYSPMSTWKNMSHQQVVSACGDVPLGFLISVPKAMRVLVVHKIQDTRFQLFLVKWACAFFTVIGLGIWTFNLLPMFLAVIVFALGICFCALLLWLGVGDMLLKFALEDGVFFELATGCHALDIFEDTESSLPQPRDLVFGSGERRVSRFGRLARKRFRLASGRRYLSRPRTSPGLNDRRTGR
jgi:hypothetical protein